MLKTNAEILVEYGPFEGVQRVGGVTYDGNNVWLAAGDHLAALDPATGEIKHSLHVPARAGTAFDGRHLYQIADGRIQKIDPSTGRVLSTIPTPTADDNSGLAWAEGSLWVGQADAKKILQIDPENGTVLRTIQSNRIVTGVAWVDGELWHATWEDNDESEIRRIDSLTGEVIESLEMPLGVGVSGLESDGADRFFCGGGSTGKIRIVRRPKRSAAASLSGS